MFKFGGKSKSSRSKMGFFGGASKRSQLQGILSGLSFSQVYSDAKGGQFGGWALERFNSVIGAHSSVEGIVEEFNLDGEDCEYESVDGYDNPWTQAYEEEYEKAQEMADMLGALGIEIDPEELIDWEIVETKAFEYACDLACAWLDGDEWIPEEVLEWAWYTLSSHNA